MIGVPFDNNDLTCLGAATEVVAELVARRDPMLVELATTYPTTEELAAWIRSLPQRNDEGMPNDGPKGDACQPTKVDHSATPARSTSRANGKRSAVR